jgi:hypothetical protein
MGKSVVRRASSGVGCSNNKGWSRALHPDSTKREKALSAGPLLALDVPTTKDGPGRFSLICPMLHVYQPKEVTAMNLSQMPQQESARDCSMQHSLMDGSAALGECAVCCVLCRGKSAC